MNKYNFKYPLLFSVFCFVLSACSNTKFLKEGQFLYTGSVLLIEGDSISKEEKNKLKDNLEPDLLPKPNQSFLGLRPRLYIYNITKEPKKPKGLRNWLKYKIGEKPVLLNDVDLNFNNEIITNYSQNRGYFNAESNFEIIKDGKKASINYTLQPHHQYHISKVNFPHDSISEINRAIAATKRRSLLKIGAPYDLETIKEERERIDTRLKEKGYYYFHPDNIIVQADSTVSKNHQVELFIKLKENTPELAKNTYTIKDVVVIPDYNLQDVKKGLYKVPMTQDSLQPYKQNNFYMVDPEKTFKPRTFRRILDFKEGDLYNRTDQNLTLNRLINLDVFKFVKNEFILADTLKHQFDTYYLLTPKKFQSLQLEMLGRQNSVNYGGGELNLNWTHRNIFKAAEQLRVALYGAFDMQLGGPRDANNIFRAGINTQLSIPRIIAPFKVKTTGPFIPKTNIIINYEYQERTKLYTLHNFNSSFGYKWKRNNKKEHELKIFDVTMVSPKRITQEYYDQIYDSIGNVINPTLKRVVDKQLIFGPNYTYTYTNTMLPKRNTIYYRALVDLSGNLFGLFSGASYKKDKVKEVLGIPFSQYAKTEHDFRYYRKLSPRSTLASRFVGGIAYPYGNSKYVPFSKQFFIGGSNSIRAFRARTLGPGSYDPNNQNSKFFFDQSGDIKLEASLEYRYKLMKYVNLAAFADAGNIWLINNDPTRPGGKFTNDFVSEIAVGIGAGVRFDFDVVILRFDLATPVRVPYLEKGHRWTFDKIDFSSKEWRKDNLLLNIAIGYPF